MISPSDLELVRCTDEPAEAVEFVVSALRRARGRGIGVIDDAVDAIRRADPRWRRGPQSSSARASAASPIASRIRSTIPYGEIPGWPVVDGDGALGHARRRHRRRGAGRRDEGSCPPLRGPPRRPRRLRLARARAAGRRDARRHERLRRHSRRSRSPGDLVLVSDHLNLQGTSPLVGPNDDTLGPRFPDMTAAYDPELRALAHECAGPARPVARRGRLRRVARARVRDAGRDPHDPHARRPTSSACRPCRRCWRRGTWASAASPSPASPTWRPGSCPSPSMPSMCSSSAARHRNG